MAAVDFVLKRAPAYRVACVSWKGPYKERRIQSEFEGIARWAAGHGVRTGKWIFVEPNERKWMVCVEVRSKAKSSGRVRLRTLRASHVASVVFDPEKVSPRLVYHGLTDWLRWRRKDKTIKSVRSSREVYSGNPWKDSRAWSNTDVQFLVRK